MMYRQNSAMAGVISYSTVRFLLCYLSEDRSVSSDIKQWRRTRTMRRITVMCLVAVMTFNQERSVMLHIITVGITWQY